MMRIASKQVQAGAIFVAIGAAAAFQAMRYELGTAREMGPGYFPLCLGVALMVVGALAVVHATLSDRHDVVGKWRFGPLVMLVAGMASFGLLLPRFGLFVAVFGTVVVCCVSQLRQRPIEIAVTAAVLSLVTVGIFIYAIGLNF